MDLVIRFPGILFWSCKIYSNDKLFASLILKLSLYQKAIATTESYQWEIKENGFFKTNIQVIDLHTKELTGEVVFDTKKEISEVSGFAGKIVTKFEVNNKKYSLIDKGESANFVWVDDKNSEIVSFDFTKIFCANFNRIGYAKILINSDENSPLLLLLGIFLIRLRMQKRELGSDV